MQRRTFALTLSLGLVLMLASTAAQAQYQLTNLASNQIGWSHHPDPMLVNGWGLARAAGSPFWVSDNGSGWSTLYDANGVKQGLEVEVPSVNDVGTGSPTGIVFNGSSDFQVQGWTAFFIFATLDGTISGWAPQSDPNNALIAVTNPGAVYTGLAITNKPSGNFLFAADSANNKVDIYNGTFAWVKSFTDTTLPAGFAPFGIQDINGQVYVAFASNSGAAGGFIDIFGEDGTFVKRLAQGAHLNQPWGMTVAPSNFGPLSNTLLVSNNTNNGNINGFNAVTGQYVGTVKDTTGKVITIDQLWGIEFGGGTPKNGRTNQLFFTAGPKGNFAGTFGVISTK
jgi:uncharacterized protein (TIGR03118 family)